MAQAVKQKEVKYLNKDFNQFKDALIEHAKTYFPNSYNDFNESSPGMMFIEMAAYVGDVLSYYVDNQFKESLLAYAEETKSVYQIAQSMGYKPRVISAANAEVDVFQTVPAIGSGTENRADLRYGQVLKEGSEFASTSGVKFYSSQDISFQFTSSASPMNISVYESSAGTPVTYLLKKSVACMSGTQKSEQFSFNNAKRYDKIRLSQTGITEIISCTDSDGNNWHQVPFLAQDTVFIESNNTADLSPQDSQFADKAPYLLKLKKTSRRFTTFITTEGLTELRFGAGVSSNPDEEIIPNPDNVGSSLPSGVASIDRTFDPSNFLNTKAYGLAPANTTLTIVYRYGGGTSHNVNSNTINRVTNALFGPPATSGLSQVLISNAQSSFAISNELSAAGGRGQESVIEVKNNALAYFQAQGRTITKEDYMMRVMTMPSRFGSVAKVYIVQDEQIQAGKDLDPKTGGSAGKNLPTANTRVANPLALNLYVLGYTQTRKLNVLNNVVKRNLATYLSEYRPVTDAVNIKDAYIINIGIRFSIVSRVGYNKQEVLLRCIDAVKLFFAPDKWQINQPIITQDLIQDIALVDGVASVVPPVEDNPEKSQLLIFNRYEKGSGYSGNIYDLDSATKDGVIYPSLDPSIFELKFPSQDIEANCVGDSTSGAGY
jgi:phage-related baseplate assembly protein